VRAQQQIDAAAARQSDQDALGQRAAGLELADEHPLEAQRDLGRDVVLEHGV